MNSGPKPHALRAAIADLISANLKSYDVAAFCSSLGLAPQGDDDPFNSKASYVRTRLVNRQLNELVDLAGRILAEWDDERLQQLVDAASARGVDGQMKNLIFAADGPKPRIILRDAINNVVEVVANAEFCLYYDRPLGDGGLRWSDLADWWAAILHTDNTEVAARDLWRRLDRSLASEPEHLLFRWYTNRYPTMPDAPALIPQVYLHYDPYVRWQGEPGTLLRQRMDFLMLLPARWRVVLEIDGKQHYAGDNGMADPHAYASMVAEDRRLRLAGYEVHRFGGAEFTHEHTARDMIHAFFSDLLDDE